MRRADNAARMLSDPMWSDAWELLTSRITEATMNAKTEPGMVRGVLMHQLAIDVRLIFEGYIKDGAALRHNIKLDKQNWWQRAA